MVFPAFPVLSRTALYEKLRIFSSAPLLQSLRIYTAAAAWLIAGRLLTAEGLKHPLPWLAASVILIPAQLFVSSRQPLPSDLAGAAIGIVLYALKAPAAVVLMSCVALRGLAPFEWAPSAQPISWIPFGALLSANWQRAALTLLEKSFFYGSAVWSLQAAGMRLRNATLIVAALLSVVELLQTHLPGRTPEVTDPIIAVLLAVAFSARSR
jgi:hypothetical protein